VPAPAGTTAEAPVVLQVASFSTRDNADRALATLQRAGIAQAQVLGAEVAGQPVWRLRVGPLAAAEEADLIARLGGLGFGSPRRVRD
jgi:rare lipoprotein A